MNGGLRKTISTSCWMVVAAVAGALALVGCGDDEDDFTETYQNCQVIDYGGGEQYQLCCVATCHYHIDYDDDEYSEHCDENRTCSSSTGAPCPNSVIDRYGYPPCFY